MPDDSSGENVTKTGMESIPEPETVSSPTPPNKPSTAAPQSITDQRVETAVQAIEDRTKRAEWLMIGLTAGIVLLTLGLVIVGVLQWRVMSGQLSEMRTGGTDTHDLAVAAGKQADRTEDLANRMKEQADRTRDLADRMKDSVQQATRLASATEKANANVIENDRPWVGAAMRIDEPELGKVPTVDVSMINTGKRPAKITLLEAQGNMFTAFPKEPPYSAKGIPSATILMPGFPVSNKYNVTEEPITQHTMDILSGDTPIFYEYVKVEYLDLRTGTPHYTHACWEHLHKTKVLPSGFYSCAEYQDAN